MPRPKKPGDDGKEVKKRSRNGCWPCKARKVKCGEEKPACANCQRQGENCDYSIRLNWDGRSKKQQNGASGFQTVSFDPQPSSSRPPAISPPINGSHPPLAPAPNLSASNIIEIPPEITSRHSSGGSSDQFLPPISAISHPPGPLPQNPGAPPVLRTPNWDGGSSMNGNISGVPSSLQSRQQLPYPSPSDSSFGNTIYAQNAFTFSGSSMHMPPPLPTTGSTLLPEAVPSPYNNAKRMRMSPRSDSFTRNPLLQRSSSYGSNNPDELSKLPFNPSTPNFMPPSYLRDPLTPATSSVGANDNDDRRISVSSLLSDDPDAEPPSRKTSSTSYPAGYDQQIYDQQVEPLRRGSLHQRMISYTETETYGHDRGLPDLDIPRNNDTMAISSATPSEHSDFESWLNDADLGIPEFGFRLESKDQALNSGGYYAAPVPIKIPKKLEPLPPTLSDNPMNLLYFHHFLNHTARILVPHDCPENPFKTILPKMAVENENLLSLMLAYSACHRARLLGHREPANRIAHWVRDVFPSLRQTLDEVENTEISNANLATAIMLASLEIISPSSFGIAIPWQNHLSLARAIIRARGGPHSVSRKDPVMYFLSRWLAYLDVLGSLSGRNEEPLFEGNYWQSSHDGTSSKELSLTDDDGDDDDDYTIDCLLGFTTRCVYILAKVASLARQCAGARINSETGEVNEDWRPSPDILKKAEKLRKDLENARNHEPRQCHHHSPILSKATLANVRRPSYPDAAAKDAEEALATNSAFHWAGLVHLLRRVHNVPRTDPQVQNAVHEIVKILRTLREGGSAEACFLFPMCTAGFEAEDPLDRAELLARLKGAEDLGMCQVSRARRVMEECWKTGVSWENLTSGDFFG